MARRGGWWRRWRRARFSLRDVGTTVAIVLSVLTFYRQFLYRHFEAHAVVVQEPCCGVPMSIAFSIRNAGTEPLTFDSIHAVFSKGNRSTYAWIGVDVSEQRCRRRIEPRIVSGGETTIVKAVFPGVERTILPEMLGSKSNGSVVAEFRLYGQNERGERVGVATRRRLKIRRGVPVYEYWVRGTPSGRMLFTEPGFDDRDFAPLPPDERPGDKLVTIGESRGVSRRCAGS